MRLRAAFFPERDGKLSVQTVLDPAVGAGGDHKDLGFGPLGQGEYAALGLHIAIGFPACLDPAEGFQIWEIGV